MAVKVHNVLFWVITPLKERERRKVISLNPSLRFGFKSQTLPGRRGFKSTEAGSN